jgi:hypothetical protein
MATLTAEDLEILNNAERLTTDVWKIVAKDHDCTWEQYRSVPYHLRLIDFQTTCERNPSNSPSSSEST